METNTAVAKRIKQLCSEKDMTIYSLCKFSGVPRSTIDSIMTGDSKNPGITTIRKLCDALDVSLADFFDSEHFR